MTTRWLAAVTDTHARRLRELDPILAAPRPFEPLEETTRGDTQLLTATAGRSRAAGLARTSHQRPIEFASCFGALRHHSLYAHLDGPDLAEALRALLETWRERLATDDPTEIETAASITWPSRDTAPLPALAQYGFSPTAVIAVRGAAAAAAADIADAGRAQTTEGLHPESNVRIRVAEPEDLESAVSLHMELLRFDEQFGTCTVRAATEDALRANLASSLARGDGTHILAERYGKPVGLAIVSLPEHTGWLTGLVAADRIGYVACLSVRATFRGQGLGRALMRVAHRRLYDSGVDTILLHHALANPHSTPFWCALGYRPLWTQWAARPGTPMFPPPPRRP
ncbi:GNAT family N-acetyltransferase [Actinobacteria bacterium YIM 96077]|uniref:GNAT family N-acetyltransferase n=1 Tax=Phytoactinopolyspora halophila TaxID=1981511 RepID=A0A329QIG1_9ACTN|nr:GNAT family N-acetyltransferase [Phytoactinopolyspora halophila]AYY14487.1 GNAT family N-acetyltransferase [Actinobacteria bacterium YIM 96077]RAW11479.1 GNAT family N-acetyltransferase [Phytoactinopolyspora halophila]